MQGRLIGKVLHIFTRDPALDRSTDEIATATASAVAKHNETGERGDLPLKNGRQPAVWSLLSLSERAYQAVTRTSLLEVQKVLPQGLRAIFDMPLYTIRREAFRYGLVSVENVTGLDGRPLKLEPETEAGVQVLAQKTVDELFRLYGPHLIGEIGQRVIDLSELDPT